MIRRMRRTTRHRLLTFSALLLLALAIAGVWAIVGEPDASSAPPEATSASTPELASDTEEKPVVDPRDGLTLDPEQFELVDGAYLQRLADGRVVHLTLVPELQRSIEKQLNSRDGGGKYKVPHGGVVALEAATGRVLAIVSASHGSQAVEHYALRAQAPSASVFKLVTAAALLEFAQIDPDRPVCYKGGSQYLSEDEIRGDSVSQEDHCATLSEALGWSINAVISRLALNNLSKEDLEEMASSFGFNREIPFELPVQVSEATFVDDDVERARTAAGFWNVNLSPMHGALIASALRNDGVIMRPTLVDRIEDAQGRVLFTSKPEPWLTTVTAARAKTLSQLAESTTTNGTAAKAFSKRKEWPADLKVTGKTGTLANKSPALTFTWFVGATTGDTDIAVGALITNTPKWWFKGMHAAANAILTYDKIVRRSK